LIVSIVFAVALVGMVFSILPYLSPVSVAHGGTAAKTVETARVNLGIPYVLPITQGGTGSIDVTTARKALNIPAILPITAGGTGATNAADAIKMLGIGLGTTFKSYSFRGPANNPGNVSNCEGFYDMINWFNCDTITTSASTGGYITVFGTISASIPLGYAGSTQIRGLLPLPADPSTYTIYGGVLGGYSGRDTDNISSWSSYGCLGYIVQNQTTKGVYLYANYVQGFTSLPSAFKIQFVVFMKPN